MFPRKVIPLHQEGEERNPWPGSRGIRWSLDFPRFCPHRVNTLFAKGNLHLVVSQMWDSAAISPLFNCGAAL